MERKIAKKIRHQIRKIQKGYEIVDRYSDGCDEYGLIYYYICKNDFHGELWEVKENENRDITLFKNNIISNGYVFKKKRYYIHSDLYFADYLSKDLVKIIDKSQFILNKKVKHNIEKIIQNIYDEIDNKENEYIKNNIYGFSSYIFKKNQYAKKFLEISPMSNYKDFVYYLENYNFNYKNIIIDILNSKKFKKYLDILGFKDRLLKI